ncbi:MAG: hypothetical protein JWN70_3384 [Planctomycetaceae bacterium]|nr:hypothetical protein [Planctomycetaceae bacterium]
MCFEQPLRSYGSRIPTEGDVWARLTPRGPVVIEKFDDDLVGRRYHWFLTHLAIKLACDKGFVKFSMSALVS